MSECQSRIRSMVRPEQMSSDLCGASKCNNLRVANVHTEIWNGSKQPRDYFNNPSMGIDDKLGDKESDKYQAVKP